jgi:large subunit ribosomal protein L23
MKLTDVIRRPLVTEKSTLQRELQNVLAFQVHVDATKVEIKQAVEQLFGVTVLEVRTSKVPSKPKRRGYTSGRTRAWKKAIVQVREGDSIPIFQGLEADL